ncbi:MAG: fimbria major subunit [Muribaculaceae bacterium]|nr:fimbria major subunit [Muribaculaceae bacterium]
MKKSYYYGAMALGLLFTACSENNLVEPTDNSPLPTDQRFFVNMSIRGDIPTGTRAITDNGNPDAATDFVEGDENAINNAYFVFYDKDGNVIGDIVPVDISSMEENSEIKEETVEKWYSSTIPVVVRKGENKPTQVICYINPISPSTLQNPLNVIQTIARTATYGVVDGTKYFAMSNSVYYPEEGDSASPQIAVQIPSDELFETEAEAEAALEDGTNLVNIYVERYASKLQFTAAAATDYETATRVYKADGTYDVVPVTLSFNNQYWALNGESKNTYVIKSFRQESNEGQIMADNYPFGTLNSRINNGLTVNNEWDWNNPNYNRSYWAISPAYFTAEYPEVADDVEKTSLNQNYLSYGELAEKGFSFDASVTGDKAAVGAKYFKETTVGTKALNSSNPAAAMPSVILVGQYNIKVGDGASAPADFYTYLSGPVNGVADDRPYVYFGNNAQGNSTVAGGESMLKRFLAQTTVLFKQTVDGASVSYSRYSIRNADDMTKLVGALEVAEISDEVKALVGTTATGALKLQANARSLQFKSAAAATGIYIATANGYMRIVDDKYGDGTVEGEVFNPATMVRLSEANRTLMQQVGYAYYYNLGKAYYNIPVKHYGWYRAGNTQKNATSIDWSQVRVGDFGMVRNHSYQVNVNKIIGLASGISGDDTPIVPPAATEDYYVAYSVRILKWAVVPQQDVDL